MDEPSRSRMSPDPEGPAGWATVRPVRGRATVWRAGQGAGALAALCMLAAETDAADFQYIRGCDALLEGPTATSLPVGPEVTIHSFWNTIVASTSEPSSPG